MNVDLKKLLENFPESELRELVQSLYGTDKQVDNRIEAALLASDSSALAKHLKKQVQSLKRGSRFISYGESSQFSRQLVQLIEQIEVIVPDDPKAAFGLTDLFMDTHQKVYNRCDDSGGSVGDSYREAMRLWLRAAAAWQASNQPCKLDWAVEVLKRHSNNDYAVWDYLISSSLALLGEQPLRELAEQFETDIKQLVAAKTSDVYDSDISRSELGLRAVAEALSDVAMYERSYLRSLPEPNELQKESITRFCLAQNDGESALKWLTGVRHQKLAGNHLKLMDEAYVMLGRDDDLLVLRRQAYSGEPGFERLQALLEIVSEPEAELLKAEASSLASSSENIIVAVDTLMKLQDMDAVDAYILQHPERLRDVGYYSLADWAVSFEQGGLTLATVMIYRVLLLDILEAGRSTAYRHAAKYYKALQRLDANLVDYQSLKNKVDFEQELHATHRRKTSFWSLVA